MSDFQGYYDRRMKAEVSNAEHEARVDIRTQDRLRRALEIKLGQTVIDAVEAGLQPQNAFKAVEGIWLQEARLDEQRKRAERSYR